MTSLIALIAGAMKKYARTGVARLAVAALCLGATSPADAGTRLPYKCVDKNGAVTTLTVEIQNEYYLPALVRALGMHSVEEYEASGLDCRSYSEWKLNIVPLGSAPLKKSASPQQSAAKPDPPPQSGPFSRFAMGDYLNAVYNGDIDTTKRLDKQYVGQQIEQLKAGMNSLGPFGKMISGAMQLDTATLVNPIIRAYAASYGANYSQCLRKDAVEFTATSTNTSTGITSTDAVYRMNPEFSRAFQDTYSAPGLGDLAHPNIDITEGIQQMMATFKCDDPLIKQFESQLLDIYAKRRAGGH